MNKKIIYLLIFIIICYIILKEIKIIFRTEKKCPSIINPKNLKGESIFTKDGKDILRNYMIHYFDDYLDKTKNDWNYILPNELKKMNKKNVFLLDIRKPKDFSKGHIPNSINIFWLDLMKPKNLERLPKNKKIIIICYVGHTASQILVLLKLLGYDAKVLKFGMGTSPQKKIPIAGWINYGYPVEKN